MNRSEANGQQPYLAQGIRTGTARRATTLLPSRMQSSSVFCYWQCFVNQPARAHRLHQRQNPLSYCTPQLAVFCSAVAFLFFSSHSLQAPVCLSFSMNCPIGFSLWHLAHHSWPGLSCLRCSKRHTAIVIIAPAGTGSNALR